MSTFFFLFFNRFLFFSKNEQIMVKNAKNAFIVKIWKFHPARLLRNIFRPARWESLSEIPPCTFIKDCTFIREHRVIGLIAGNSRVEVVQLLLGKAWLAMALAAKQCFLLRHSITVLGGTNSWCQYYCFLFSRSPFSIHVEYSNNLQSILAP